MAETLGTVAVVVALTSPTNWAIRSLLRRIRVAPTPGSEGAGRWIGILERSIIFLLVAGGEAGAAGLVVAAKAILRFPEIAGDESHLSAEYVLIGSLASWLFAILAGLGVRGMWAI
ncbi:MAG: hypothetical protein ACLFWM_13540 [Actinomycetota bacterium]